MYNRKSNDSLLDWLWANFANIKVNDSPSNNPTNSLLTEQAINLLLNLLKKYNISNVHTLKVPEGIRLIANSVQGGEVFNVLIPFGILISGFGKRKITSEDKNNGCLLDIDTPVYYIKMSDGTEYLTEIDRPEGITTESVIVSLIENAVRADLRINNCHSIVPLTITNKGVQADLNISQNKGSVRLRKEFDGLKADIILGGTDKVLNFKLLTLDQYLGLKRVDETTFYFIKDKSFFYLGSTLFGFDYSKYYTKKEIDEKLSNIQELITWTYID